MNTTRFLLVIVMLQSIASFSQSFMGDTRLKRQIDTTVTSSVADQPADLEDRPLNNIFANILGDASVASLNYERLFLIDPEHVFIAAGAGVGLNYFVLIHNSNGSNTYSTEKYVIFPHHVTCNIGKGRHFLELGVGGAALAGPRAQPYLPYLTAGYRIQPWTKNKLHFRIFGSYPLESLEKFEILYIPAGISIGWSF